MCLIAIFLEMCKQASINDTLMTRKETAKEYKKARKVTKSEKSAANSSSEDESEWDEAQIMYARSQLSMNLVPQRDSHRSNKSNRQSKSTNDFESLHQLRDSLIE